MKNTNTAKNTKNAWTFAANTVTVNNRTFEASYSIGKAEDVYVFAKINNVPIRIHVGKDMPEYAACLAAAQVKPEPKPAQGAKPAEQPKAEPKPAEQPKAEPKPAEQPKQTQPAPVEKAWIGTTLTGKGFNIAFDEKTQRTRVLFQGEPTKAQKDAVIAAGFYWSAQLQSYNKKLTCKAHRAAVALFDALNALTAA